MGGEGSRVGAVDAIVIPARVANDSEVGSEADTVGTMRVHVRGGSNVERLAPTTSSQVQMIHGYRVSSTPYLSANKPRLATHDTHTQSSARPCNT